MNGVGALILLICAMIVAVTGVVLINSNVERIKEANTYEETTDVQVINVIGQNITNNSFRHIRVSVKTDGVLELNSTLITLRTQEDVADLRYRNGTLVRDVATGFYTQ